MATILIVDDDADNREILGRLMQRDGYSVVCAGSGKQAIDQLGSSNPSLVLLDIRMPGMDGIEFLGVIRSYRRWQNLPVIVLSGLPDEDRERASKYGVRHVLQKGSLDFAGIRQLIKTELSNSTAPSATTS